MISPKKITITVEAKEVHDGCDVSIKPSGEVIEKIFAEGDQDWNDIKGAIHAIIAVMGLAKYGRNVTIETEGGRWP